jgi:hypothetical protein
MNSEIASEERRYIATHLGRVVKKKYTRLHVMSEEFNVS